MTPTASVLVRLGIPGLTLGVWLLALLGVQRVLREPRTTLRLGAAVALWLGYAAWLAQSGLLARTDLLPPPMLLLLVPLLALCGALAWSPLGTRLAQHTPLPWLVGLHIFRLPLELVMHQAAREHVMPEQMTFTGANFDILSGASALLLTAALALRPGSGLRRWVWAFNVLGSLLLALVVGVAVASLPSFHLFGSDPARLNTWVLSFPYVWLPAGLVAAALSGQLLLWRRLLARPYTDAAVPPRATLPVRAAS